MQTIELKGSTPKVILQNGKDYRIIWKPLTTGSSERIVVETQDGTDALGEIRWRPIQWVGPGETERVYGKYTPEEILLWVIKTINAG